MEPVDASAAVVPGLVLPGAVDVAPGPVLPGAVDVPVKAQPLSLTQTYNWLEDEGTSRADYPPTLEFWESVA
jgi:hypothetical protein